MIITIRTVILLVVAIVVLFLAVRSLRAQRLKERYVLLIGLTGVPFLILAFWPDGVVFLERLLVIEKPTLLVLCVTIYFLITTFELLSIVSVQDRKIAAIGQHVGILLEHLDGRSASRDRPASAPPEAADISSGGEGPEREG